MQDYTAGPGEIIRGSRWPAADESLLVILTKVNGWPAGSDDWTWELLLSHSARGGDPDLAVEAETATVSGEGDTVMTLEFSLTAAETASLPGEGRQEFHVDVRSTDDGEAPVVCYYDCVQGTAWVRDPAGEGA
jgi:hypothetical protein